jgi:alpha-L-rhamnosidase
MALPNTSSSVTLSHLRVEHLPEALGIGADRPRISWIVETETPAWRQAAYEIESFAADGSPRGSTGRVESDQSVLVDWPFAPLASRERLTLRLRAWGAADDRPSAWSEPLALEAGLLHPQDWSARFITPAWDEDVAHPQPGPLLRREFTLKKDVLQARLYTTALGVYETYLNGQPVGDHVLDPGWTSYHHRLVYQTYDITSWLRPGPNAIGAMLGEGWFRGRLGYGGGKRNLYGSRLAFLAQIEIIYTDGSTQQVLSDATWRAATGPILSGELYDGEVYDARLERPGWCQPKYDESGWSGVRLLERDLGTLVAPSGPPVRRIECLSPLNITTSPSGRTLLDFGQNLVGRLRIRVQGPAGQVITLRHAEVLENGELATRPLRFAKATDSYTLKGSGVETWEPRFTYHGFRYAEVTGWPGTLQQDSIRAVVCHSDLRRTGWFECSDPLINRLHENVVWSMRGNFVSLPTDCPQRDERLGWTGDIQVFAPAASFLYDSAGFLSGWLADLAAEQSATGSVPFYVPNMLAQPELVPPAAAAWGDAAVIVPWVLYQRYGDAGILSRQFDSMCAWVDCIAHIAGESRLWDTGLQFGDWLDPASAPDKPGDARTPGFIVATAYFAFSAELVGRAARAIGRVEEEARYLALADEVRAAFNAHYVTPAGRVIGDSATAYALALQFALLPTEKLRRQAGKRLVDLLRSNRYRISTGFVGTPLICDALCSVGEYQAAYRLLTQRENPSWLYPVTMGATTIWERWDSLLPDGSVNPGEMTSFNHYALGAVADWLHRSVAGLAPAAPGYRQFEIRPVPGGHLTSAGARLDTPYGPAETRWNIADGQFHLELLLPPNTTASVTLPGQAGAAPLVVASGRHHWTLPYPAENTPQAPLSLEMSIGELIDRPAVFSSILNIFREYNPELTDRIASQTTLSLRQAAALMPDPEVILVRVEAALNKLG